MLLFLKRREKRITGARNLTSDEYVEMLKECERKKKEEEELKKQKKEEREKKKTEREKKKEEVQKRKREKVEKKKGKCKSVKRAPLHRRIRLSSSESENSDVSPSLAKKRCEEPDPETDDEYEESDIDCGKKPRDQAILQVVHNEAYGSQLVFEMTVMMMLNQSAPFVTVLNLWVYRVAPYSG